MSDTPKPQFSPARVATLLLFVVVGVFALPHLIPMILGFAILIAIAIPLAAVDAGLRWLWKWFLSGGFRLHLSTAIVLMLVAGAFVGVNVNPYALPGIWPEDTMERGWPARYVIYTTAVEGQRVHYRNHWALVGNGIVLLVTLVGVWAVLERPRKSQP